MPVFWSPSVVSVRARVSLVGPIQRSVSPNLYFGSGGWQSGDVSYEQTSDLLESEDGIFQREYRGARTTYNVGYQEDDSGFRGFPRLCAAYRRSTGLAVCRIFLQTRRQRTYSFGPGLSVGMNWDKTGPSF